MAGQISAAEGAIRKGAETVASTRNDLESRIKTVDSQMLAIGSNWVCPASAAFQRLMSQWNTESTKVTRALIDFEENLRATQTDYEVTDSEQQSTFNSLQSRRGAI